MGLSAGTRLGPYEIVGPIGAGGMGEVYKARDTRLGRIVAIKVAQEKFSERFEREARAVAALNHPHICALYDVGPNYLVMEYVEGRPVSGPLSLDQSLKYAAQICDALDAAHRKGIVHRDLKPGNILITKSGVKLLDFGLARMDSGRFGDNTTFDPKLTQTGVVMGTPAYMSPEQWDGKPGDARSDIYAFGCVLYEMLTGKRAAEGRGVVEPATVESVLRGCLERDPEDRWQSASDTRRALQVPAAPVAPVRSPWRERIAWILGVAIAIAAALFFASARPTVQSTEGVTRFNIYAPEKTVFAGARNTTITVPQFAMSPDGRMIVFAAGAPNGKPMLWVKSMEEVSGRPLAGTENGEYPFWFPDDHSIGFFAQGKLKTIPAAGGPVKEVVDVPDPRGGSWNSNGTILFGTGTGGVFRVPDSGGEKPVELRKLDASLQEGSHRWPGFLPDGTHFLFNLRSGLADRRGLYVGSLDGATPKLLVHSDASALYANGYLLFLSGNTLLAQKFDEQQLKLSGQTFVAADGVSRATTAYVAVSVSRGGVLAYSNALLNPSGQLTWTDREGNHRNTVGPEGVYSDFRLSHDEKRLATSRVDAKTGNIDIYMTDLTQENRTQQFTFGPLLNASVLWSHDDTLVAFRTTRNGGLNDFYQKSSAGGGKEEPFLLLDIALAAGTSLSSLVLTDWSSDGRYILYTSGGSAGSQLWLLPMSGDRKPSLFRESSSDIMHANFSPNGRSIAYTSNESGRYEVWVETVPRSDKKKQISIDGGYEPRWRADGGEIYFLSEDRKLMAVKVEPDFSFGSPRVLFQTRVAQGVYASHVHYLPSRDGRFLMNIQIGEPTSPPITIVLNWIQGLKK
jgi:dipeptidyl aminopeptidase/acylaminoacyl peptidase/predicted Ser/Thr protein kinase